MKPITILAILTILFASCKHEPIKEEDPLKNVQVVTDIYTSYDIDTGILKGEANFQAGKYREHAIAAHLNGKLYINEFEVPKIPLKRKYYKYSLKKKTPAPKEYSFKFDLENGLKEQIDLPYMPIDTFFISPSQFTENDPLIIHWEGPPLEKEETMMIMFTDANDEIKPWRMNGPSDKNKLIVPKELIYTLATGPGTIYLTRRRRVEGISKIMDYIITTEFVTPKVNYRSTK